MPRSEQINLLLRTERIISVQQKLGQELKEPESQLWIFVCFQVCLEHGHDVMQYVTDDGTYEK